MPQDIIGPNDSDELIGEKLKLMGVFAATLVVTALLGGGQNSIFAGLLTTVGYALILIEKRGHAARRAADMEIEK